MSDASPGSGDIGGTRVGSDWIASCRSARVERDAELVARIRKGDEGAFSELYTIYWPILCRTAATIVGEDAPDVVQQVFVKLWRIRERLVINSSVAAYLFRVVRNRALDDREQGTRRRRNEWAFSLGATARHGDTPYVDNPEWLAELNEQTAAVFSSGEARAMRGDVDVALERAIQIMSPRRREALAMWWDAGVGGAHLTYAEIGAALDIVPSTVRQHVIEARRILDACLDRAGWSNVLERQESRPRKGGSHAA